MLVLSRKTNQTIKIGEQIEVKLLRSSGGRVTIGITAPDSVRILRGEVADFQALASDWEMIGVDFSSAIESIAYGSPEDVEV